MKSLIKIAFLNNFRRLSRTILALLGIMIGICALIVLVSVVDGIYESAKDSFSSFQGVIVYKEDSFSPLTDYFSDSYENKIKTIPGVERVVFQLVHLIGEVEGKKTVFQGPQTSSRLVAMNPSDYKYSFYINAYENVIKGRSLKDTDNDAIMISSKVAEDYSKSVNSKIKLDSVSYTIVGIFEAKTTSDETVFLIMPEKMRDSYSIPQNEVTLLIAIPTNPNNTKRLGELIEFKYDELTAINQEDLVDNIGSVLNNLKILVVIISIVAAIVAGVGVINTMLMSVMDRVQEIGTLKAVGWTSSNIVTMIVLESLFIGVMGGILGVALGIAGSIIIGSIFNIATHVTISTIIWTFSFAVSMGLIGGLYPAYTASKLDPVEALRSD